jgi:WhiB family redox-sensing transcriptional regulator
MTGYASSGFKTRRGVWTDQAACIDMDTDIFFPSKGNAFYQIAEAKAACARCPVQVECLEYALTMGRELIGIFGGMTDNERRRYLRARRKEYHVA